MLLTVPKNYSKRDHESTIVCRIAATTTDILDSKRYNDFALMELSPGW